MALVVLFLFFLAYEFALVSSLPLMTELLPRNRATMMAGIAAMFASGRMIGALIGPHLFAIDLWVNAGVIAGLDVLAIVILLRYIRQA